MSDDLLKNIEKMDREGGIFLEDAPPGKLIEIYTQNTIYRLAVIDAKKGLVAADSTGMEITCPKIYNLAGSTFGGSAIRLHWIGIGMHMELWGYCAARPLLTSAVNTIRLLDQPEKLKTLIETAKKNTPYQ